MIIKDIPEGNNFTLTTTANDEEGLCMFFDIRPDVPVADVMMPRTNGFEMVRRIRQTDRQAPILFLAARSTTNDIVEDFGLGVNSCLKKSFGMQELVIRIKVLAGKIFSSAEGKKITTRFKMDSYLLDTLAQTLIHTGLGQEPPHRETEILGRLCENQNQAVNTRNVLLDLWGDGSFFNSRSLHVSITKLRHRLSADECIRIVSVREIGYKLILN